MKVAKRSPMLKHGVVVFLSLFILAVLIAWIKPAPTGFVAATCGATITADTTQTAGITDCDASTGITIGANNIVLDCAGYTVDGMDELGTIGILASGRNNITIKNCVITDWVQGISLNNANSSLVQNNTLTSNTNFGVRIQSTADHNIIRDNIANSNTNGVSSGTGFSVVLSTNNTFINNTANSNLAIGFVIGSGANNLTNNTANSNTQQGFSISGTASNLTILANITAKSNTQNGVLFTNVNSTIITNSTISGNGGTTQHDFLSATNGNNITGLSVDFGGPIVNFVVANLSLRNTSVPAADPSGYKSIGKFLNATNTTATTFLAFINFSYTDAEIAGVSESSLLIARYNGVNWSINSDFANSFGVDTANNFVYANITNASGQFAPMGVPAPTVTINNNSNSSVNSNNPVVYVTASSASKNSFYVEVFRNDSNGSAVNISYGLQQNNTATARTWTNNSNAEGIYTYYGRAYDNATNDVSSSNFTMVVDRTNPTVNASITLHANQTVTNNSWVANFTIADNLFYTNYSIEFDSVNYTPTGNTSNPSGLHALYITRTFTLTSGNHTFAAYANDSAGNGDKIVNSWINLQSSAPTVAITAPANNSTIVSTVPNITVNITDNEQLSFYAEIFRNGTNISYASAVQNNTQTNLTWTNASSSEGIYTYFARAYDNLSNGVSSGNRTIILDVTSPTITNVSISPLNVTVTNNSAHVFNFSITDNIYLENTIIELNNSANGSAINYSLTKDSAQFNFTINFSALANNNYTIIVYANDSGGNSARFANNWLNVNVPSGGGVAQGGGDSTSEGGGSFTGVAGNISPENRTLRIPNAEKEVEVFITIPITKDGKTTTKTYRAVLRDILTSTAQVRFEPNYNPIVLNPGQQAFVDLDGNGVNDVMVTLHGVSKGVADITFDVIAPLPKPGEETSEEGGLESGEFEEGAAGSSEKITTRVLAFISMMALIAGVFIVRFFPEIFGLKVKERKD